jgi:hypothetical protein
MPESCKESEMSKLVMTSIAVTVVVSGLSVAAQPAVDWVARSDRNTEVMLEVLARFNPEAAGFLGIDQRDEDILVLSPDRDDQQIKALRGAIATLDERLATETDPRVRLDLEILIRSASFNIEQIRLQRELTLPYVSLPQVIFGGVRSLLDGQVSSQRRAAAVRRLQRYAGLEEGYSPLTAQAETLLRIRLQNPDLLGPFRGELENDLATTERYLAGIRELLSSFEISDADRAVAELDQQLRKYNEFLRQHVLPRARDGFRLPRPLYDLLLERMGVDMPVEELTRRAQVAFCEIQNEMRVLAALIAEQQGFPSKDYRDVIRQLRKAQLDGSEILAHYTRRIAELEKIITDHGIVSLPERSMRVRLASEAESAAVPSPFMRPPKLIGNTGEVGELVLPNRIASAGGDGGGRVDDYTFAAASWTLAVHEGRPGHELQYTALIENGVSRARSIFAFNSVNVEGWAVYCEAEMKPHLPFDGQLISLQKKLLRAARAFLDPGLQAGAISEAGALRVLEEDVALSPALARQELERYTFRDPAQATSYFCGYLRLVEIRAAAAVKMGERFDLRAFHDFVLAQGLLPPSLLRRAVMEGFVGQTDASS